MSNLLKFKSCHAEQSAAWLSAGRALGSAVPRGRRGEASQILRAYGPQNDITLKVYTVNLRKK